MLCAYGHAAWLSLAAQVHHNFTIEVAAVDEQGLATTLQMSSAMQISGIAEVTDIVAIAGEHGFVSLSLEKQP